MSIANHRHPAISRWVRIVLACLCPAFAFAGGCQGLAPAPTATTTLTTTATATLTASPTAAPSPTPTPTVTFTPSPSLTATRLPAPTVFVLPRWDNPYTIGLFPDSTLEEAANRCVVESVEFDDGVDLFPNISYTVRAAYTGEYHRIPPLRFYLLRGLLTPFGDPEKAAWFMGLYRNEYRFTSQGVDYWIPVQSQVAPYFALELIPGEEADLKIRWFGVNYRDLPKDCVFWLIDFQALKP